MRLVKEASIESLPAHGQIKLARLVIGVTCRRAFLFSIQPQKSIFELLYAEQQKSRASNFQDEQLFLSKRYFPAQSFD